MTARYHPDPKIDAAIASLWSSHPYYAGTVARKLRIVADPAVATMATSADWVTHYNAEQVARWSVAETGAVLVHELEHLLRRHSDRCGGREHGRFNVAADAEINQRLSGLPDGAVYPSSLGMPNGLTAETYYGAAAGQTPPQGADGGQPAPGQPGNCGSAAGGPQQPHEQGDERRPGPGAADPDAARKEVAQEVMGQVGRMPGTAEGDELRDWAESELGIDRGQWYTALAGALGTALASYSAPTRWTWPGRRDPRDVGGAMLPRWTGTRPSCAVVIDTSSSITPADLDMARAAGHFIGRMADAVYWGCDTRATRYGPAMPDRLLGGGGTALRNGIDAAIADGAKAVVVITDCYTGWGGTEPTVPVIIGGNAAAGPAGPQDGWALPEWATYIPVIAD